MTEDTRQVWGSKLQFLLTCIGYAVGLGNLWKFPSEAYKNGGGAFLVPYVICSVVVGLPCLYLELFLGQFTRSGASKAFRHYAPVFQGIGWTSTIMSGMIGVYYNVVVAICLIYLKDVVVARRSMWVSCGHPWNKEGCTKLNESASLTEMKLPTDQYYMYNVFEFNDNPTKFGAVNWQLFGVLLFVWILTAVCLIKGVKWIGKISYVTATVPYLIIGAMFVRCIMLDGAINGIYYFVKPEFEQLKNPETWIAAAKQICLSISIGYGGILSLSSYNQRNHNCFKDAAIVVFADMFMSIFGGCVVFATLGHLNKMSNVPIPKLINSSSGLAFSVYPEALDQMILGEFWAFLLFLMFFLLGISSQFGSTQTLVTSIVDQVPSLAKRTWLVVVSVCAVSFSLGFFICWQNGFSILELISNNVGGSLVLFTCAMEIFVIIHFYGVHKFMHDIRCCLGVGRTKFAQIFGHTGYAFAFLWTFVTPAVLLVLTGFSIYKSIENCGKERWCGFGFSIEYTPLLAVPAFFLYNVWSFSKTKEGWMEAFKVQKQHPSYDRIRNGGKVCPAV